MFKKIMVLLVTFMLIVTTVFAVGDTNDRKEIKSFTLDEAKEYAIEHSKEIELAKLSVEKAELNKRKVLREIKDIDDSRVFGYEMEVKKEVTPDKLEMAIKLSEKVYEATVEGIKVGVENNYYKVKNAEDLVSIQKEAIERSKEQLNMAKTRLEVGVANEVEVTMAELDLSDLELELKNLELDLNSARMNLNKSLNLPIDDIIELVTDVEFKEFKEVGVDELIAATFEDRVDMYQLEEEYNLIKKETEILNKFYTENTYQYKNQQYVVEEALLKLEDKKQDIEIEVRLDYQNLDNIKNSIGKVENSIKKVEENLRITKLRYESGMAILEDVLDIENQLKQIKAQKVNLEYNYLTLKSKLENYLD